MLLFPKNTGSADQGYKGKNFACEHCGQAVPVSEIVENSDKQFCCRGCRIVWDILANNRHDQINQSQSQNSKYQWLDNPDYNQDYLTNDPAGFSLIYLYVEGLDCHSCFWTLEKLPLLLKGVTESKVDLQTSVLKVGFDNTILLSQIVSFIETLGYPTHPLKDFSSLRIEQTKEKRKELVRIGIAGASAANAMVYSIANYAGADGVFLSIFHYYSVLFSLPALTYCSLPFYKKALGALKQGVFNIDFSISLAILLGGAYGIYTSLILEQMSYIDSLSMLVFLLLLTRFALKNAIRKGAITNSFAQFFQSYSCKKLTDPNGTETAGNLTELPAHKIAPGDYILVERNELIPADGQIIKGESYINESTLTGESQPNLRKVGQVVYAGTLNEGAPIQMQVTQNFKQSRMGKILGTVEANIQDESEFAKLSDRIAKNLLTLVLILGFVGSIFHYLKSGSLAPGLELVITLLIVTCPCALGLNSPMVYQKAMGFLTSLGVMVKSPSVLEKTNEIQHLFFDKTGTLTEKGLKIEQFEVFDTNEEKSSAIIRDLLIIESNSHHPVASALCQYLQKNYSTPSIDDASNLNIKNIPSVGVEAVLGNHRWLIIKTDHSNKQIPHSHSILRDGELVAAFTISEIVNPEVRKLLTDLKNMGLHLHLLSGDQSARVEDLVKNSQLKFETIQGDATPETKKSTLDHYPNSAMIGDGANDSLALSAKNVLGISVNKSMPLAISASDVWLQAMGLSGIKQLIVTSKETKRLLRQNIALSLSYNVASIILTLMGLISPLIAAFLMPLSALTITLSIALFPFTNILKGGHKT